MTLFRLLVVEDDSELRSLLVRGLSEEGFDVQAVGDAAAAMARARDVPDALVIDIGLPDAGAGLLKAVTVLSESAPSLRPTL